jgi:hypothetical protein
MPLKAQQRAKWEKQVAEAQRQHAQGRTIIEKRLGVTGERFADKRFGSWSLSAPAPLSELPLRYEYAFGGQCRVAAEEPYADKVPAKVRLSEKARAAHPQSPQAPVAHSVYAPNPVGRGYWPPWWIRLSNPDRLPAPQIEHPDAPFTEALIRRLVDGTIDPAEPAFRAAGLGIEHKAVPRRLKCAGNIDRAFIESDRWLPDDFSFAVWNGAPQDQQAAYLQGNETITLTNLCKPSAPGATTDSAGNTCLRLTLPGHRCYLLVRMAGGELFSHDMAIDTLIIEPEEQTVTLVWRAVLLKDEELPIRVLEARLRNCERIAQIAALERVMTPATESVHAR